MWENFGASYGNWLIRNQNADGSFYRAYGYGGEAVQATTFNTTNPIRFLVELYLFTGDQQFLRVSRLLANNTAQATELSGNMGYSRRGLSEEATSVANFEHDFTDGEHRTSYWLPWLTVGQVEPLADLRDMFGSMSIDGIETQPLSQRQQTNDSYPRRRRPGDPRYRALMLPFSLARDGYRLATAGGSRRSDPDAGSVRMRPRSVQWGACLYGSPRLGDLSAAPSPKR
jgi:hypothetical protein